MLSDVRRWFGNVTTSSLSHWSSDGFAWTDLFWFLWSPYTVFTVHLLPTVERIDKETTEEFANRVQKVIADYLKVCLLSLFISTQAVGTIALSLMFLCFSYSFNSTDVPNTNIVYLCHLVKCSGSART